jgi:transposase-like protein
VRFRPLNQSALLELTETMRTADDGKLMRTMLHTILQALVDAEATERIGAGMHEQNDTRTTQRNGTRTKVLANAVRVDLSWTRPANQEEAVAVGTPS